MTVAVSVVAAMTMAVVLTPPPSRKTEPQYGSPGFRLWKSLEISPSWAGSQ